MNLEVLMCLHAANNVSRPKQICKSWVQICMSYKALGSHLENSQSWVSQFKD